MIVLVSVALAVMLTAINYLPLASIGIRSLLLGAVGTVLLAVVLEQLWGNYWPRCR
jgi:hypothetical protein